MGLLLLGIGIFAYVDGQDFNQLVDDIASANGSDFTIGLYGGTSLLIIITSCIIVVVSFLGYCGAWKVFRITLCSLIFFQIKYFSIITYRIENLYSTFLGK